MSDNEYKLSPLRGRAESNLVQAAIELQKLVRFKGMIRFEISNLSTTDVAAGASVLETGLEDFLRAKDSPPALKDRFGTAKTLLREWFCKSRPFAETVLFVAQQASSSVTMIYILYI
jgi:hypothetical protein